MPLVLETLKTFYLAKTRNRYYRIHTSIPPCPQTPPPLRYACGSSGLHAAPPPLGPPPDRAANTPPPHPNCPPPPASFDRLLGGGSHQDQL